MHVLALPMREADRDARESWYQEIVKLTARLETQFDTMITPAKLHDAIRVMNRERALRRRLAAFMQADAPPLTGRQLLQYKSSVSGIPADFVQYERAIAELALQQPRRDAPVRVLLTGVPLPHGAERVLNLIEEHGGLVVAQENCTGLRPLVEDVEEGHPDPLRAIADKYYHLPCSVMSPNSQRMDLLRQLARDYRPQCVIELVWQACLTYDDESYFVRKLAETELNIPYLRIQTDYSPADSARIITRIEALFETVQTTRYSA
jgi:benzoyl-CoA reductase/2-hydroxyglutaryl-CoA dehydratase subunit BcrC/BadD/HgdB